MTKTLNCPTCLKTIVWSTDNPFRPFCSERCKLIDLGDWASGKNVIAGEPVDIEDSNESQRDQDDLLPY